MDKITTVDLIRRMFGGVGARIETTDGSTFEGKLLTKDIEVVYESSGALTRIECRVDAPPSTRRLLRMHLEGHHHSMPLQE